jgi:hypothetical protein
VIANTHSSENPPREILQGIAFSLSPFMSVFLPDS